MNALDRTLFLALHQSIIDFGIRPPVLWFFADILPYGALAAGLAIVLWFKRDNMGKITKTALFIIGSAAFSRFVITELIRFFWNRPRPFEVLDITAFLSHNGGHSFPSGHAAFFFAAAVALWVVDRRIGYMLFGVSALMGLGRIAGGIHWPSDVAAGAVIGVLSVWVMLVISRKFLRKFYTDQHG